MKTILRFSCLLVLCWSAASVTGAISSIDTVRVPVHMLKYTGSTVRANQQSAVYTGRVVYKINASDNDSFNVALSILKQGTKEAQPTGIIGGDPAQFVVKSFGKPERTIHFSCTLATPIASAYVASLTIQANKSALERKVDELLSTLTVNEKAFMCYGTGVYQPAATGHVTRLGIPGLIMRDGPIGIQCDAGCGYSTVFPAGTALGNTFDTAMVRRVGEATGEEFRDRGYYVCLGPTINLVRDMRGGRNAESFGEDPFLTGTLSASKSRGLQNTGTAATNKHYVCNDRETDRHKYSSDVPERTLREIYTYPFEIAVRDDNAWAVMSSYNLVNSEHASENRHLLTDILKNDLGFRGYVVSDWEGTYSCAKSFNAGQDVEMPKGVHYSGIASAVGSGAISLERLNDAVRRILRVQVWANVIGRPVRAFAGSTNSAAHKQVALEAGRKSIVLTKNQGNLLPLSKTIGKVAVVGPLADVQRNGPSGSASVFPTDTITPRKGIIDKIGAARVTTD
jgi:beta-glucosidase